MSDLVNTRAPFVNVLVGQVVLGVCDWSVVYKQTYYEAGMAEPSVAKLFGLRRNKGDAEQ